MSSSTKDKPAAEVAKIDTYRQDDLLKINSWDDAVALAKQELGTVATADEELGDGFSVLATEHKSRLVGVPMFLMEWRFTDGDNGRFVSARVVAQRADGRVEKYILNDGSTGICKQLEDYQAASGRTGGLMVKKGLRRSDYKYTDAKGDERPATTFYLDTSA